MDSQVAFAHALAIAMSSDIDNPAMANAIQNGGLTKEEFTRIVNRDIMNGLTGAPGPALFPNTRAFVRQQIDIVAIKNHQKTSGLGQVSAVSVSPSLAGGITSLAGAITGAVGAIWGAKITTSAEKDLAKIQLQESQTVLESQQIANDTARIQNATAAGLPSDAQGNPIDPSTGKPLTAIGAAAQAKVNGMPVWGIATSAAAFLIGTAMMAKG